jgi:hypothetical protein
MTASRCFVVLVGGFDSIDGDDRVAERRPPGELAGAHRVQ